MSKEINDSENICTAVDAFEEFSANSIYNEDEYITLKDIVSPSFQEPETSSDLRELPYDNEFEVLSNQGPQNVNTSTISFKDAAYSEIADNNPDGLLKEDGDPTTTDIGSSEVVKSPSKRVRKKKSYYDDDEFSPYRRNSGRVRRTANTTSNVLTSHQDCSLTSTQKKRGRKPKNKTFKLYSDQSHVVDNTCVQENSGAISPLTSNVDKITNSIVTEKKRPGRPKKLKPDQCIIKPDSTNDSFNQSVGDDARNTLSKTVMQKQRKPKKKVKDSINICESSETVTLENISDSTNSDLELKDILEGKKARRRSKYKNSTDISSTEKHGIEICETVSILNIDEDTILNKLNEMFSDQENIIDETHRTVESADTATENEALVESTTEETSRNVDTSNNINIATHKESGKKKKANLILQSTVEQNTENKSEGSNIQINTKNVTNPDSNNTPNFNDNVDDGEDICLSKLKESMIRENMSIEKGELTSDIDSEQVTSLEIESKNVNESNTKRNVKMPVMEDFEYNIDSVINDSVQKEDKEESLLVEDTSKRSIRKRKQMQYEVDSDEDPFANVELSDDDEPKRNRKGRYNSDDEYVPSMEKRKHRTNSDSGSDIIELNDLETIAKRKRKTNKSDFISPRKRSKKNKKTVKESEELLTINCDEDNDIEEFLEPAVIKLNENTSSSAWGTTNEFENFLATKIANSNIKIKKCSDKQTKNIAPLEIPIIDQNTPKKFIDVSSQTSTSETKNVSSQTDTLYDIPMKDTIMLTNEQSEKACEFLNSIVTTTVELGQLMTEKSQDFIKKKINTAHVTDTMKMDYCVKKSFLLFKLAKHNLEQMEEDLSKQYEDFLKTHDLLKCRIEPKKIEPKPKHVDDDSDCEIVEVPIVSKTRKSATKPNFNPKTVFLNKELSIKIAKKPTEKNIKIPGKHAVWISDSVMVKKVKPTQSFLAQDSRNKKPPDNYFITAEMVNNFFVYYYRQGQIAKIVSDFFNNYCKEKVVKVCSPLTSTDSLRVSHSYICNYFVVTADLMNEPTSALNGINREISTSSTISTTSPNINILKPIINKFQPESLLTICTLKLQKYFIYTNDNIQMGELPDILLKSPLSLFQLCINALNISDDAKTVELSPNEFLEDSQSFTSSSSFYNMTNDENYIFEEIMLHNPVSLFKLCMSAVTEHIYIPEIPATYNDTIVKMVQSPSVTSLKTMCYRKFINIYFSDNSLSLNSNVPGCIVDLGESSCKSLVSREEILLLDEKFIDCSIHKDVKTLATLCTEIIQKILSITCLSESKEYRKMLFNPLSLNEIILNYVNNKLKESITNKALDGENFTIGCVNTLSEEAFHNLEHIPLNNIEYTNMDDDNSQGFGDQYHDDFVNQEEQINSEDTWLSQVQLQEPRTCATPTMEETNNIKEVENNLTPIIAQVKLEPTEDIPENVVDTSIVKSEPLHNLDEMTVIPENVFTKSELVNIPEGELEVERRGSASYDVDAFEAFVQRNKIMQSLNEYNNEEIFTQSMFRVRRQFEPDYDVNDLNNSLLVPQTFEPLLENAKGSLMQSSSDEGASSKKQAGKKKGEKRKTRVKKLEPKTSKDTSNSLKDKPLVNSDIAIMTRRMRDRIRQEEKKVASSDSETEDITINTIKDKKNDRNNKSKDLPKIKNVSNDKLPNEKSSKLKEMPLENSKNILDSEIQCNAVDSTEQLNETVDIKSSDNQHHLTSTISQDNNSSTENNMINDHFLSSMLDFSQPAEMVECEPIMPMFDIVGRGRKTRKPAGPKNNETKSNTFDSMVDTIHEASSTNVNDINESSEEPKTDVEANKINFTDRDGWHCYPINPNDKKLYQQSCISLDKLPESFVETYFQYQKLTEKTKEDEEVDRLINLSSLSRIPSVKDGKHKSNHKGTEDAKDPSKPYDINVSRVTSPSYSEHCAELTPSEDERDNVDDIKPPLVPFIKQTTENNLAKSSLMNDNDSDTAIADEAPPDETLVKRRPGPKSKTKILIKPKPDDLMLTADKMMNKELQLLNTPVVLKDGAPEVVAKGSVPKPRQQKTSSRVERSLKERLHVEEDSSSEEEKQWVNTKEKLLKRMGKKEDAIADDAKRAKLVSEFIERRGASRVRRKTAGRPRRSKKKLLERQKQLRVLSRELLREPVESVGGVKRYSQAYAKGRRNIRKVIDKKSLATSTVIANMEEFERKRRLNAKQNRLRDILGCEEGVNVLVINDEVCLEYDFEEERPVVTIHPFFTKVMKAHQYEGVKFMWDACFESLEMIESGHPGGGCILAHCMGLGKTLQVLALLHTVLTHSRVGMSRVLVCCPLSTVLNWVDEIHKWIGPVTNQIKVFELSKLRKTYERAYQLEDWYNGGGIFIIGYELFRSLTTLDPDFDDIRPTIISKIRTALLDPGPDIIVCDEGHLLKNDCSVLAVAMSRVVTKRRIVLTGTPMQNNLREYYCMVNFVKPNLLGKYSEYSNRFENPIMNGQHRDSSEEDIKLMKARTHILHKVLEGCLQRQEASVLYPYLPKKHEYTVFIPLTKCQWDLYKHYIEIYGRKSKQSILKDFHILQKIWSHPQVLHNFQMRSREEKNRVKLEKLEDDLAREDLVSEDMKPEETEVWWLNYLDDGTSLDSLESSNKFVAVFRILDECNALGDKVLIFSTSLFSLDGLEYFLKKINKWSLGQEYYRLDGSVPPEVRQKWCREFNAENNRTTKLFLISTRAGCLGLNMTAANRVIILDTSWNPAHDIQSIFRVYRFGQKKDCYIYRLVALGTMEQKIYERSVTKQAVACRVVDEQQIDRHYNMAELTELYRYDELGTSVASGVAVGVGDVALLRVARDAAVHAVHEHDSLLRGSGEQGLPEHERNAAWMQFQQEHANKQMQNEMQMKNELLKSQQPKKGKKSKVANVKISLPPETSVEIKTETNVDEVANSVVPPDTIENEPMGEPDDSSKNDADYVPPYSFREKKGRKSTTATTPTKTSSPTKPQDKVQQPTLNKVPPVTDKVKILEEEMIQGITLILKKHNFQANNEPHKIMGLINNVKNLAFGGGYTMDDPLSQHIANFVMQRNLHSAPAMTHFICEAINRSINEESGLVPASTSRKRGRPTKLNKQIASKEVHDPPSTSTVTPIIEITVKDTKQTMETRSRKQVRAPPPERKEVSQTVIGSGSDCNIVIQSSVRPIVSITEKTKPMERAPINVDESIVLSDDDDEAPLSTMSNMQTEEPKIVTKKPKEVSKKVKVGSKKSKYEAQKPQEQAKPENPEKIPLHPSLLTNAHFIKIVAHTYLDGNKMLDEDAALLAAQYSTSKTLQEYERTGKSIESGPIYDIAMEVLGPDFLKKVHLSNPKVQPAAPVTQPLLKVKDNLMRSPTPVELKKIAAEPQKTPVESKKLPETKNKPGPLSKKLRVTSEPTKSSKAPSPAPQIVANEHTAATSRPASSYMVPVPPLRPITPNPNHVVPVGLFRTINAPAPSLLPADSECILPDDDEVHIINDESSIVPTTNSAVAAENNFNLVHETQRPLIVNTLSNISGWQYVANPAESTAPPPTKIPSITISSGRIVPNTLGHEPTKPSNHAADVAISLDSDDEESITPHIQSQKPARPPAASQPVIPILESLRAVGPQGQMIPVSAPPTPILKIQPKKLFKIVRKKPAETTPTMMIDGLSKNILKLKPDGQLVMEPWKNIPKIKIVKAQAPGVPVQASDAPVPATEATPQTSSPSAQASPAKVPEETCVNETAPVPERTRKVSSSSSDSSRSASPHDPLSILRDVIQIRAADEPKSTNKKNIKPSKMGSQAPVVKEVKKPTPSTSKNVTSLSKPDPVANKNLSNPNMLKKTIHTEMKKSQELIKKVDSMLAEEKLKIANRNPPLKLTIDLTKANNVISSKSNSKGTTKTPSVVTVKKAASEKTPDSGKLAGVKVVGTTKNLIFNGKSITTKDHPTSKPAVATTSSQSDNKPLTLKYPKSLPTVTPKVEKRRTTVLTSSSAPKKQKFNPTMTLKDFNIDDIDDIIELE